MSVIRRRKEDSIGGFPGEDAVTLMSEEKLSLPGICFHDRRWTGTTGNNAAWVKVSFIG